MSPQLASYHRRAAAGKCVACGKRRPVGGTKRCAPCRKTRAETSAKQKRDRPKGSCAQCYKRKARVNRTTCAHCSGLNNTKSKQQHNERRRTVIERYGGCCRCCGNANHKFLHLDHVNNDGNKERAKLPWGARGGHFFKIVLKQPVRADLQLLCANCHNAKRYGGCTPADHIWP